MNSKSKTDSYAPVPAQIVKLSCFLAVGYVTVTFKADATRSRYGGFFLAYTVEQASSCQNASVYLSSMGSSASGWISQDMISQMSKQPNVSFTRPPDYSPAIWLSSYQPLSNCEYLIRGAPGATISVSLEFMDIRNGMDALTLYKGTKALASSQVHTFSGGKLLSSAASISATSDTSGELWFAVGSAGAVVTGTCF